MTDDEKEKCAKRAMQMALDKWCRDTNHTYNIPMSAWPIMAKAAVEAVKD